MHYDVTPDTGRFYVVRHAAGRSTIECDCLTERSALREARRLNGLQEATQRAREGTIAAEVARDDLRHRWSGGGDQLSLLVD